MKFFIRWYYWAADLSKKQEDICCTFSYDVVPRQQKSVNVSVYKLPHVVFVVTHGNLKKQFGYFKFNESQQKQHAVYKPRHFYYFDNII